MSKVQRPQLRIDIFLAKVAFNKALDAFPSRTLDLGPWTLDNKLDDE
jgi:hypothetical protein